MARSALPPRRRRAVCAIAEAVFAGEDGPPPPARLDWLATELEDFLARSGTRARAVSRLMILAVSILGSIFALRPWPFARLAVATRIRGLARLEASMLSGPILALKAILCIVWYEHPEVARQVGFDEACLMEPG